MKAYRKNIFETNSSSTHSLTLLQTDRKFSRKGKLVEGNTYYYEPLGVKNNQKRGKIVYSSEFEKLCVCFDLLFLDFQNKSYLINDKPQNLERFRKSKNDAYYVLLERYYLKKFLKTNCNYYREFQMVLKKHNIDFIINDLSLNSNKSDRAPIYCESIDCGAFDFMSHFSYWGFQSISEAIDNIVFNPKFIIEFEFRSC